MRIRSLLARVLIGAVITALGATPAAGTHGDGVRPLPPPDPVRLACGGVHPFTDVEVMSYAADEIACLLSIGVASGTSATTFDPARPITRDEAAVMAWKLWSVPFSGLCPAGPAPFVDISTSFAVREITCMWQQGFTTGTTPTTFEPREALTREQLAAFIARIWRSLLYQTCCDPILATHVVCPVGPMPFTDVAAGSFAAVDIACLFNLGVTTGTTPTTFEPHRPATREEAAVMVARLYRQTPIEVFAPI